MNPLVRNSWRGLASKAVGTGGGPSLFYQATPINAKRIFKQTVLGTCSLGIFALMKAVEMENPHDFMFWPSVPIVGSAFSALFLGMTKLSTRDSVSEMYLNKDVAGGEFTIRTFTMLGNVSGKEIKVPAKGLAFHGFGHRPNYFFMRVQDEHRLAKHRILRLERNEITERLVGMDKQQQAAPAAVTPLKRKKN